MQAMPPDFFFVHRRLSRSAGEHGDKVAIVGEPGITYRAFESRANSLAQALVNHCGVQRGDRIAICLPKSEDFVLAIFATLKAGAAYVPLDAGQPPARLSTILADSEPRVLIAGAAQATALIARGLPASLRTIFVREPLTSELGGVDVRSLHAAMAESNEAEPPEIAAEPDDLAALLYTSGSTGVPKGVQITHRNLHTFIAWALSEMDLRSSDVFSNHAGYHFDLSTFDLYACVAVGGTLWIVREHEVQSPAELFRGITRYGVSVMYVVPSVLSLMITAKVAFAELQRSLRYVLFAGEVFPIKLLRELQGMLPGVELYNLYGPTETNVCTFHRVGTIPEERHAPVPIGRPITGVKARVDVVDGVGELVIEGPCVTPGYWRRTGYDNEANHRRGMHATGDLVTLEGDEYVYHGRKDRMVKLNGFRVELGEVEAAMLTHPAIVETAVVISRPADTAARIVAFYALQGDAVAPSVLELKTHMSRLVPRYMIPHTFTRLDALPKNANGKTDVKQLAASLAD